MRAEGAEYRYAYQNQERDRCLNGHTQSQVLCRVRRDAGMDVTFEPRHQPPAMQGGQAQHRSEQCQLEQHQVAVQAVKQRCDGPAGQIRVVQDAGHHQDADENGAWA